MPRRRTSRDRAVRREQDLRRSRTAVVGRAERGRVRAGIGDRDEVAAPQRRQVVCAERVGRFADRPFDADRLRAAGPGPSSTGRPSEVRADDRMAGAVQRRPDQLGHPRIDDDLAPAAVAHVEDAGDQPAGPRHERPSRLDRQACRPPIRGDRVEQRPAARGRSAPGSGPARRAGGPGTRRRGRACRTSRSSHASSAVDREGLADGVPPGVDRAELRSDVQVDAARPQTARPRRRRPSTAAAISVSVIPNFEAPAPTARPAERLRSDVGVEPVEDVEPRVRRPRATARAPARAASSRRFEGHPAQRILDGRPSRGAQVARRLADALERDALVGHAGSPGDRPLAARDHVGTEPACGDRRDDRRDVVRLDRVLADDGSGKASRDVRAGASSVGEVGDEDRRAVGAARCACRQRRRGDARSGTTSPR